MTKYEQVRQFLIGEKIKKLKAEQKVMEVRLFVEEAKRKQAEYELRYNHNHDPKNGRFTSGTGLTGGGKSDRLNKTPMYRKDDKANSGYTYISVERIHQLTVEVRKNGATVIINEPWFNKRLKDNNASAATYGDIIVFGEKVTLSDVLEECHHYMQNMNHLNSNKPEPLRTYLNEIDAKEFLLKSISKYRIPRKETELTQKQLASYRNLLEEYKRGENNG